MSLPDWMRRLGRKVDPDLLILSVDPGETVGYAVFTGDGRLLQAAQLRCGAPEDVARLQAMLYLQPDLLVVEEYRVYPHKTRQHAGDTLFTSQVIGALRALYASRTPMYFQSASLVKGFCTDKRLREWGLYCTRQRHANDAIRHGVWFLLFSQDCPVIKEEA